MTLRSSTLIMGLLLATVSAGGMLACSGSEEEAPADEAPSEPPARAADETQPAPISSNTNSAPAPDSDPDPALDGDGGTAEGGGGKGTGPGTGGGTGGGGSGTKCEASAPVEKEANDTAQTANAVPGVSTSVCGSLSSKADVDFFKFTLPADTTGFAMGFNYSKGGLDIEVSVDGKTFKVGQTPELVPGKEYLVKVSTTGDGPNDYRWSMTIDK